MLAMTNGLNPGSWRFEPGMLFGANIRWWGQGGPRKAPHNGLDIRKYEESSGRVIALDGSSRAPAARDGEVINIIKDFLGFTVFVSHKGTTGGARLFSAYGHIVPEAGLSPGAGLSKGEIIGTLSEYDGMPVPPHLHLSFFEIQAGIAREHLDWDELEGAEGVRFIDPGDL